MFLYRFLLSHANVILFKENPFVNFSYLRRSLHPVAITDTQDVEILFNSKGDAYFRNAKYPESIVFNNQDFIQCSM
jgi:hypothetical protein